MTKRPAKDDGGNAGEDNPSKASDRFIKSLNALSASDFQQKFIRSEQLELDNSLLKAHGLTLSFKPSVDLTKEELETCFNLIASTSRGDYEASSWSWHPRRKKREMRESEMRYLLARHVDTNRTDADPTNATIEGFLSFMLTHDSSPNVPVLYIYEIHLDPALRKIGLGAHLMQIAEHIASSVGVKKVMLTCFVSNEKALGFYESRGYATDVISPEDRVTRTKTLKADYVILSKEVSKG